MDSLYRHFNLPWWKTEGVFPRSVSQYAKTQVCQNGVPGSSPFTVWRCNRSLNAPFMTNTFAESRTIICQTVSHVPQVYCHREVCFCPWESGLCTKVVTNSSGPSLQVVLQSTKYCTMTTLHVYAPYCHDNSLAGLYSLRDLCMGLFIPRANTFWQVAVAIQLTVKITNKSLHHLWKVCKDEN